MTGSNLPNPQDKEPAEGSRETVDGALGDQADTPEDATPVTPAPIEASPSSTGVVAGDGDEPDEARPPQS